MKLGEKIRYLREVEGSLRGLGRPMTQLELVRALREETAKDAPGKSKNKSGSKRITISQSYLSQIENGSRPHMTQSSRALLARFFKVHPGFLVDDPEGYHTELTSDLRTTEGQLDVWLLQGSEKFANDPEVSHVLIKAAREKDTRHALLLLGAILDTPGLADRLLEALRPDVAKRHESSSRRQCGREANPMTLTRFEWSDFYLICFAIGFCFSFFSFVFGGSRFGRLHLPHFHGHSIAGRARSGCRRSCARGPWARDWPVANRDTSARTAAVFRRLIRHRSRLFWLGSAAPDICSPAFRLSGWDWDCCFPLSAASSAEELFFSSSAAC